MLIKTAPPPAPCNLGRGCVPVPSFPAQGNLVRYDTLKGPSPRRTTSRRAWREALAAFARMMFYDGGVRLTGPADRKDRRPSLSAPEAYYDRQVIGSAGRTLFSDLLGARVEFVYSAMDGDEPARCTGILLECGQRTLTFGCGEMVIELDHARLISVASA